MKVIPDWWRKPRQVTIVVDNPSWIVPFAKRLVEDICDRGDEGLFITTYDAVPKGDVAFYLGCVKICPPDLIARNRRNLVVHESDLPVGRGFSPLTWQILEGKSIIPVVLLDVTEAVDAGPIIYRKQIVFEGHELIDELRQRLGETTVALCEQFLAESAPPDGNPQNGEATYFLRRRPKDSKLDPYKTIAEQFDLLRVVDNSRYPAYFEFRGQTYKLAITKLNQ